MCMRNEAYGHGELTSKVGIRGCGLGPDFFVTYGYTSF